MVIEQYPYIDDDGKENFGLVKHSSDEGKLIVKEETGEEFEDAIDIYPCKFHYSEKEEPEEIDADSEEPSES